MNSKGCFDISDAQRNELIEQLVSFVPTDTVLFLPAKEEKIHSMIHTLNSFLNTSYVLSCGIEVLPQNVQQGRKIKQYLENLGDADVAFIYQVGKELRSVLLAILLKARKLTLRQAFDLAFYEELCQQQDWGKTEEIVNRQENILKKLTGLCEQYDKRSLS